MIKIKKAKSYFKKALVKLINELDKNKKNKLTQLVTKAGTHHHKSYSH